MTKSPHTQSARPSDGGRRPERESTGVLRPEHGSAGEGMAGGRCAGARGGRGGQEGPTAARLGGAALRPAGRAAVGGRDASAWPRRRGARERGRTRRKGRRQPRRIHQVNRGTEEPRKRGSRASTGVEPALASRADAKRPTLLRRYSIRRWRRGGIYALELWRARAKAAGSTEWCHVSYDSASSSSSRKSSGLSSSRSERSDPARSGAPEGGAVRPHHGTAARVRGAWNLVW